MPAQKKTPSGFLPLIAVPASLLAAGALIAPYVMSNGADQPDIPNEVESVASLDPTDDANEGAGEATPNGGQTESNGGSNDRTNRETRPGSEQASNEPGPSEPGESTNRRNQLSGDVVRDENALDENLQNDQGATDSQMAGNDDSTTKANPEDDRDPESGPEEQIADGGSNAGSSSQTNNANAGASAASEAGSQTRDEADSQIASANRDPAGSNRIDGAGQPQPNGNPAQGSVAQGSVAQGSVAQESSTQGISTQGSSTQGTQTVNRPVLPARAPVTQRPGSIDFTRANLLNVGPRVSTEPALTPVQTFSPPVAETRTARPVEIPVEVEVIDEQKDQ